jgi:hypothetical protein
MTGAGNKSATNPIGHEVPRVRLARKLKGSTAAAALRVFADSDGQPPVNATSSDPQSRSARVVERVQCVGVETNKLDQRYDRQPLFGYLYSGERDFRPTRTLEELRQASATTFAAWPRPGSHGLGLSDPRRTVSRARARLLRRVHRTPIPHVRRRRARPADARFSREAPRWRFCHGDHTRRAASRSALSRPIPAALRSHWRAEQSASQGGVIGTVRRTLDALGRRARGPSARLAGHRAGQASLLSRSPRVRPAGRLVSASHLRRRRGEDAAILSRQTTNRCPARWRGAARLPVPRHPRGDQRLPDVPVDARRSAHRVDEWTIRVIVPRRFHKAAALGFYDSLDAGSTTGPSNASTSPRIRHSAYTSSANSSENVASSRARRNGSERSRTTIGSGGFGSSRRSKLAAASEKSSASSSSSCGGI